MKCRILVILAVGLLVGCKKKPSMTIPEPAYELSRSSETFGQVQEESSDLRTVQRKVITTANISFESKTSDSICLKVIRLAQEHEGYIVSYSTGSVTVRVPDVQFGSLLDTIAAFGKVTSKSISGQDVTAEYEDLKIKLDNAEKARQRYLELLAKAENVQASLLVEKELERLNREIDLMKGRAQYLSEMSSYATIHVTVKTKVQPGPLGYLIYIPVKVIAKLFIWKQ